MDILYERKINYYETDRMGIVHHANYIKYFEEARIFFLDKIGLSYKSLEELGIIMPVLDVQCRYLNPSDFDDTVTVKITLSRLGSAKAAFNYEVTNKKTSAILCTGSSTHGFLSSEFKPLNVKKAFPLIYEKLLEELNTEP